MGPPGFEPGTKGL